MISSGHEKITKKVFHSVCSGKRTVLKRAFQGGAPKKKTRGCDLGPWAVKC